MSLKIMKLRLFGMTATYTEEKQYKAIPKAGQCVFYGSWDFTLKKSVTFNTMLRFVDYFMTCFK